MRLKQKKPLKFEKKKFQRQFNITSNLKKKDFEDTAKHL